MEKQKSRLVFPNLEGDIVKVVDLIFRTQRTVGRHVVPVPLGPFSGQMGYQRDDVQALSLNLRRQTHNPLV